MRLLDEVVTRFSVEVHAYALMPNHYHLLVRSGGDLSRSMRHLNACYTQETNRVQSWDGPLFRGRFRSQLLQQEGQLPYVLAYIHLNPLRANLVTRLTSECWTSHLAYIGRENAPGWLTQKFFLSYLGGGAHLHDYVLNLHRGRSPWPEYLSLDTGSIAATTSDETAKLQPDTKQSSNRSEQLELVSRITGAPLEELRRVEHGPRANPARRFAVWALVRRVGMTHRETGEALKMSRQQVSNVLQRWPAKDNRMISWCQALENQI